MTSRDCDPFQFVPAWLCQNDCNTDDLRGYCKASKSQKREETIPNGQRKDAELLKNIQFNIFITFNAKRICDM